MEPILMLGIPGFTVLVPYSKWAVELVERSRGLLKSTGVFDVDGDPSLVRVRAELKTTRGDWRPPWPDDSLGVLEHSFWAVTGVAVECLAKAVLVKHQVMSLSNRHLEHRLNERHVREVLHVYTGLRSFRVNPENNVWLGHEFTTKGIEYVADIGTPTLGHICNRELPKLLLNGVFTQRELDTLRDQLQLFTFFRRNVYAHICLPPTLIGSFCSDVEAVFIPMMNTLFETYARSPASQSA